MSSLKACLMSHVVRSRSFSHQQKNRHKGGFLVSGRDERIRTSDFLHPMQALYQAELRPVCKVCYISNFSNMQAFFNQPTKKFCKLFFKSNNSFLSFVSFSICISSSFETALEGEDVTGESP